MKGAIKTNPSVSAVEPNPLFHLACRCTSPSLTYCLYIFISLHLRRKTMQGGLIRVSAEQGGHFFRAFAVLNPL